MAEQQPTFVVAQVQAVSFAVTPVATVFAVACLHPVVVAMRLEAMLPDIHEVVLVDVALLVVRTDAGAGTDAAIDHIEISDSKVNYDGEINVKIFFNGVATE